MSGRQWNIPVCTTPVHVALSAAAVVSLFGGGACWQAPDEEDSWAVRRLALASKLVAR